MTFEDGQSDVNRDVLPGWMGSCTFCAGIRKRRRGQDIFAKGWKKVSIQGGRSRSHEETHAE